MKQLLYLLALGALMAACNSEDSTITAKELQKMLDKHTKTEKNNAAGEYFDDVMDCVNPVLDQMDSLTDLVKNRASADELFAQANKTSTTASTKKGTLVMVLCFNDAILLKDSLKAKGTNLINSVYKLSSFFVYNKHQLKTHSLDGKKMNELLAQYFSAHDDFVSYQHTFANANGIRLNKSQANDKGVKIRANSTN